MKKINKIWLLILLAVGFSLALQANARQSATIAGCGSEGSGYSCPSGTYAFKGDCYLANDVAPTCNPQLFDCDTGNCIGQTIIPATTTPTWIRVNSNYVASGDSNDKVSIGGTQPAADVRLVVGSGAIGANIIGINGAANDYTGVRITDSSAVNSINEKWFMGHDKDNNFVVRNAPHDYLTIHPNNGNIEIMAPPSSSFNSTIYLGTNYGAIALLASSTVVTLNSAGMNVSNKMTVAGNVKAARIALSNYTLGTGIDLTVNGAYIDQLAVGTASGSGLKGSGTINADQLCLDGVCKTDWASIGGASQWTTSGTNISNSNTGNVGIGTGYATEKLTIKGAGTNGSAVIGAGKWGGTTEYSAIGLAGLITTGDYNFTSSPSDKNLYINRPTGKDILFRENNTAENMIIKGVSGNVGINNVNPTAKLDIVGTIKITDGTQGAGKVLTSDANGLASWQTPTAGVGGGSNYWTSSNGVLVADTSHKWVQIGSSVISGASPELDLLIASTTGNSRVRVSAASNNIANTRAEYNLATQVGSSQANIGNLALNGWGDFYLWMANSSNPNGIQPLYVNGTTGNIGIGTTNPTNIPTYGANTPSEAYKSPGKLWVSDTTSGVAPSIIVNGPENGGASVTLAKNGSAKATVGIYNNSFDLANYVDGGAIWFWTNDNGTVERKMLIDSNGNVGIGAKWYPPAEVRLDVDGAVKIRNTNPAGASQPCTTALLGTIRYNAGTFEGCSNKGGLGWKPLN